MIPYLLSAAAIAAVVAGSYTRVFDVYEYSTYDWRFQMKPPLAASPDIVMIDIWDDSLQQIGEFPFSREYHAYLLDVLREYGAKMLGFDILLVESREGDEEFAAAAKNFGRMYFSEVLAQPFHDEQGRWASQKYQASLLDVYRDAAAGIGHANAVVDRDGKRRRAAPAIFLDGKPHYQLGILMAADYLGIPRNELEAGPHSLRLGPHRTAPLDESGYLLVHFAGKWKETYKHYSYIDILKSHTQAESGQKPLLDLSAILKDKVCFLGLTATGTHDINPIPLEPLYPQVGLHANVFNMIVQDAYLWRLPRRWNLLILVLLAAAAMWLTRIPRLQVSIGAALLTLGGFAVLAMALFAFGLIWIDLFYPSIVFGLIYLGGVLRRTMSEKKKRELIEAELSIASNIQRSFLPTTLPECPFLDISVFMKPAKHVGGDLYTAFKIDDHRMGVMLGDVSGKGAPAALFMAKSVSEFKFNSRGSSDPAHVLTTLNDSLANDQSSGLFVTAAFAVFDGEKRTALFSNGGHLPVIKVAADGKSEQLMPDGGMPLSLMPGIEFANLETPLRKGDIFVFYSDGISEAKNTRRQDYEIERLTQVITREKDASSKDIEKAVLAEIDQFVGNAPQHDDMTLLIVKVSA